MTVKKIICICIVITLVFGGCRSATIKPFQGQEDPVQARTDGEKRLWLSAGKLDEALVKSGQIFENEPLRAYLQGITDHLYPEFQGAIKIHLLKDPVLNAFALPNGSIYINTGMIAALENEAQIATVLAHEGVHFTHKHSALQREHTHNAIGASIAVSLLGVPFIGQLVALSSIFGYSQEHEYEADCLGYERLSRAGYDTRQSPKTFEHLLREAKADKISEPFFFSTHPALEKRIENFNKLNADTPSKETQIHEARYNAIVGPIREMVIKEKIKMGRYSAVVAALTHNELSVLYPSHCEFYLGEAYRLRGEKDDAKKALDAYLEAGKKDPSFSLVDRAIGMVYYKNEDYPNARQYFEIYLKKAPDAEDAGFISHYLELIKNKGF